METKQFQLKTHRRGFLGLITGTAAAIGLSGVISPFKLHAALPDQVFDIDNKNLMDADKWFNGVKGKHKIVYDVTQPHEIYPFLWPKVFLLTNQMTGSKALDCGIVVSLRHAGIIYAFEDRLWAKYKFGEMFKETDPKTSSSSIRNQFWKPQQGDFKVPGFGEVAIGINELQAEGVMFSVCYAAITAYSAHVADMMKADPQDVKKEWIAGLLPGVQVVPSGVWAVGRAQEHGCAYCFAG